MDDKKVNNPNPNPNPSDTFKSTDIYASKASNQADYFAHVKPTFQEKLRTKLKNTKSDPVAKKRLRRIIVITAAALLVIILGLVACLIIIPNLTNSNQEQQPDQSQSSEVEGAGGADSVIEVDREASADAIQEANDLIKEDAEDPTVEAIRHLDQQIAATDDAALIFDYNIAAANIYAEYNLPQKALDRLSAIKQSNLTDKQKFKLYRSLAVTYNQLGDTASEQAYQQQASALSPIISGVAK